MPSDGTPGPLRGGPKHKSGGRKIPRKKGGSTNVKAKGSK